MDHQKFWFDILKPAMIEFIKEAQKELEDQGYIPTIELLIEKLENTKLNEA